MLCVNGEGGGPRTVDVIQRFCKLRMGGGGGWLRTMVTAAGVHRVLHHALQSNELNRSRNFLFQIALKTKTINLYSFPTI